ncbi:MAG: hypothetical protein AB7O74_00270 [Candidatus Nanopelagicales bacterium]
MGEAREIRPTDAGHGPQAPGQHAPGPQADGPQAADPQAAAATDPTSPLRQVARRAKAAWCFLVSGLG